MDISIQELRDLVLYMKEHKVLAFTTGTVSFEFSPEAFKPAYDTLSLDKPMSEEEKKRLEDEILFHSAG